MRHYRAMNKLQKYLVGTLFDEQEQDKKTNLNNMKAKDPSGRTRWQGAFTGGFVAGYKNTCGSKDGWTPSSFVSSVMKKAEPTQQSVLDYMDKEDLGRENIGNNITLNTQFQSTSSARPEEQMNFALQESIGERILGKLKKAEAHRTAPENEQELDRLLKVYEQEETVQHQYQLADLPQPITVGAAPNQVATDDFVQAYQELYRKVIREHAKQETEQEKQQRREENKIYFDFTRPLEEQPSYLREIADLEEQAKPRKRTKNLINQQSLSAIFTPGASYQQFKKAAEIEKAPEDYDPYQRVREYQEQGRGVGFETKPRQMTAEKRGAMIGEVRLGSKFVAAHNSLANKFVSTEKKTAELKKFFQDEKKNKRFHDYIEEMEGKKISSQLEYMDYSQAEKERKEFDTMYKSHQANKAKQPAPTPKTQATQAKKQGGEFNVTRSTDGWRPEKLLCKRYSVNTPYVVHKPQHHQYARQFEA